MKTSSTKDLIDYLYFNWMSKKDSKRFVKLFHEYLHSTLAVWIWFNFRWFWTFEVKDFHSNLKWWNEFKRLKFTPSDNIKLLISRKW